MCHCVSGNGEGTRDETGRIRDWNGWPHGSAAMASPSLLQWT